MEREGERGEAREIRREERGKKSKGRQSERTN